MTNLYAVSALGTNDVRVGSGRRKASWTLISQEAKTINSKWIKNVTMMHNTKNYLEETLTTRPYGGSASVSSHSSIVLRADCHIFFKCVKIHTV